MAREILPVPEDHLEDVIFVIRAGLSATIGGFSPDGKHRDLEPEVREQLAKWCGEEEEYLRR